MMVGCFNENMQTVSKIRKIQTQTKIQIKIWKQISKLEWMLSGLLLSQHYEF